MPHIFDSEKLVINETANNYNSNLRFAIFTLNAANIDQQFVQNGY